MPGNMTLSSRRGPAAKPGFKYRPQFGVIVICKDEREQARTYKTLLKLGHKLKVVTV